MWSFKLHKAGETKDLQWGLNGHTSKFSFKQKDVGVFGGTK